MSHFFSLLLSAQQQSNYLSQQDNFVDQVFMVTGAGDGIGKAIALDLASRGARVILLGRTQSKLEAVFDQIMQQGGQEPVILPIDLKDLDESQARTIMRAIEEQFNRLDGLVHCASILGQQTPIENYAYTAWLQVMQVNVNAAFLLSKQALKLLNQSKHGRIIFTSSSVGKQARAYWGAYGISKFAIEGLAHTLAEELENTSQTKVYCINPGATATSMRAQAYPSEHPASIKPSATLAPIYGLLLQAHQNTQLEVSFDANDYLFSN